jgi:serine/threonine-protein phosphatase 4 catalytic subunit
MIKSDLDRVIDSLKKCQIVPENDVKLLCKRAVEDFSKEGNVLNLSTPITVCGDLHGQFYDLMEIFAIGDIPPQTNYLFLGDYVDRGLYSVETFLLLLALKVRYPGKVALIRGNHESRQISQVYGFYDECFRKYGSAEVWSCCVEVFDCLALGAVIDNKLFAVHGGISPKLPTVSSIDLLDRKQEVPVEGPMCDLLWSDPEDIEDWAISTRGAGYLFGKDSVLKWNHANNFDLVIRAHQLIKEGYRFMFDDNLVTVWSAPNYCYRCGNVAAILELDENLQSKYKIFVEAPKEFRTQQSEEIAHYFL